MAKIESIRELHCFQVFTSILRILTFIMKCKHENDIKNYMLRHFCPDYFSNLVFFAMCITTTMSTEFGVQKVNTDTTHCGWSSFMTYKKLTQSCPASFKVNIWTLGDLVEGDENSQLLGPQDQFNGEKRLALELEAIWNESPLMKFTDMKLQIKDIIFSVHKSILAGTQNRFCRISMLQSQCYMVPFEDFESLVFFCIARSPMFDCLFETQLGKNGQPDILSIPDCCPKMMHSMLEYIYTGKLKKPITSKWEQNSSIVSLIIDFIVYALVL